jgi:hypothetical protein
MHACLGEPFVRRPVVCQAALWSKGLALTYRSVSMQQHVREAVQVVRVISLQSLHNKPAQQEGFDFHADLI